MTGNAHHGGMLVQVPTTMETFTGRFVDTLAPAPDQVVVEDIAHHLSTINRYGGAPGEPVSVGAHTLLVCDLVRHMGHPSLIQLAALTHDATEYALNDKISPLKYAQRVEEYRYLVELVGDRADVPAFEDFRGAYGRLSDRMDVAVGAALGIDPELFDHPAVKLADMWALRIEAERYTHTGGQNWRWEGELPEDGQLPAGIMLAFGLPPHIVEKLWLSYYERLRAS